uniref:Uncharacterized protein n=1 Tax=Oryza meridionalis TaxID=40149 RepID=A0A0E0DXC2_9ORYZ
MAHLSEKGVQLRAHLSAKEENSFKLRPPWRREPRAVTVATNSSPLLPPLSPRAGEPRNQETPEPPPPLVDRSRAKKPRAERHRCRSPTGGPPLPLANRRAKKPKETPHCLRRSPEAMEQLADGQHVALRSVFYGSYIYADEDGRGVSLHPRRSSPNAAWVVHRLLDGGSHILLYGVSYGRYHAATEISAPSGLRGNLVVQQSFDRREDECVLKWETVRVASADDILVRSVSGRCLRASDFGVTVDEDDGRGMTLRWVVEAITQRDSVPPQQPQRGFQQHEEPEIRTIRFVQDGSSGLTSGQDRQNTFTFTGRSVQRLKQELAHHVGAQRLKECTVCIQAGLYGHPTPLVLDLPRNREVVSIEALVVYQVAQTAYDNKMREFNEKNMEYLRRMQEVRWSDLTKEDAKITRKEMKKMHSELAKLKREISTMEVKLIDAREVYQRAMTRHGHAPDPMLMPPRGRRYRSRTSHAAK